MYYCELWQKIIKDRHILGDWLEIAEASEIIKVNLHFKYAQMTRNTVAWFSKRVKLNHNGDMEWNKGREHKWGQLSWSNAENCEMEKNDLCCHHSNWKTGSNEAWNWLCLFVFVCVRERALQSHSSSEQPWSERVKVKEKKKRRNERERERDYILSFALPANLSPFFHPSHSTCQECSL